MNKHKKVSWACLVLIVGLLAAQVTTAQLPQFTELVKKAAPAVVNITATRSVPRGMGQLDEEQVPEFFRRFFRDMPQGNTPRPAAGSGFIISKDGYILTNNHVIDGASEIIVALSDRRERVATLVGADPLSDLALLKIDADDLPVVEIGDSESLEVGEWVIAIGSPFGFELSVTSGIISAKGRSLPEERGNNYVPYLQTDVPINPGNSGGPLIDLDGKVVGINSQIFTRSGGYMGLSFAIPVDVAMEVVEQLKDKGVVSRGWLGVLIQRVDRDLAEAYGLDRPSGALVTQVFDDSPAAEAGLKEGDIILEFNNRHIDLSSDLPHIVGRTRADTEAPVKIVRDSKQSTLTVKVGALDSSDLDQLSQGPGAPAGNQLGVVVRDMTDAEKKRAGVTKGVLVQNVTRGAGREAGIANGDVITTLDSQWVDSKQQFEQIVDKLEDGVAIPVRVVRNQQPQFLVIKISR